MKMEIVQQRRAATFTPMFDVPSQRLKAKDTVACWVLGLYQATDEEGPNPYFIIELTDGRVRFADPRTIQFTEVPD